MAEAQLTGTPAFNFRKLLLNTAAAPPMLLLHAAHERERNNDALAELRSRQQGLTEAVDGMGRIVHRAKPRGDGTYEIEARGTLEPLHAD
jgi:hypothetical protein